MRRQGNPKRKPRLGERRFLMGFFRALRLGTSNIRLAEPSKVQKKLGVSPHTRRLEQWLHNPGNDAECEHGRRYNPRLIPHHGILPLAVGLSMAPASVCTGTPSRLNRDDGYPPQPPSCA